MDIGKAVYLPSGSGRQVVGGVMLACCVVFSGCSKKSDQEIFAKVGDRVITQQQFQDFLDVKRVDRNRADVVSRYKQDFLRKEQIAQAIATTDLVDLSKLDAEINETRKELILGRYFEKFLNDKVNEDAVLKYYNENAEKYSAKKARVSHILIRTNPDASEQERQAKSTLAHEIYSKLNTGTSFVEMVKQYSDDAISKKKDGDLNWLSEGAVAPEFSNTVFNELKIGEVSQPVLTQLGYHIIKLVEGPALVKSPLEKVKGDIRYQLRKEAKDAELERLASLIDVENK